MHREAHYWYSPRLSREMGVIVHGHWGPPMIAFPTSGGDEWEYERQGVIGAIAGFIEAGRVKVFSVNTNHVDSFGNSAAHPRHRSWMQAQYDEYIVHEVVPFVRSHCRSHDVPLWTMGASLGAYHAVNTLLKHPDIVKRCYALSGVYDMTRFMDGDYDDNFYFNNPVDYAPGLSDPWALHHLASCDIHLATGTGLWEQPEEAYRLSRILAGRGIAHHLDDWGQQGGHDWPYWRHQMGEYLAQT
ncbi:MAG TPA: alpha/beta hydrolase-fold protein [Vicinamibacterales bacterium]|nr:alpha/beta hydrolase-fold protein [Vicinamibacterales bacterium]